MQHLQAGDRVPEVTFKTRNNHEWVDVTSAEVFDGRRVVVFSLPGAFTPTCSSAHVPRYNQLADTFSELGVDEIICLSVNDAFVMDQWQKDQQAWNIRFLPDGNGAFTAGMGLLVDKDDLGFGRRSWRYAMVVNDGVIEQMFVEPEEPGDPFHVSDADTVLKYLAPGRAAPPDVTVFTRAGCGHCARARRALHAAGLAFEELELGSGISDRTMRAVAGATTFPQVFVNGRRIGGADDVEAWLAEDRAA